MLESLIAGGLTGVLGSLFSNVLDVVKIWQKNKFELSKMEYDLKVMDREYQYHIEMKNIDAETKRDVADADLMGRSYAHDASAYSVGREIKSPILTGALVVVDLIRGLIRPVMTAILLVVLWETRMEVKGILDAAGIEGIGPMQAIIIYGRLVDAIIFMSSSAILWWFGTRVKGKK